MDIFYLGYGTLEEQFGHQVAMAVTREYVNEYSIHYNRNAFQKCIKKIDKLVNNRSEFLVFCQRIAPYRYVDDTLLPLNQCNQ